MDVVTVIPVKPLDRAKSRLAPFLEDEKRRRLVIAMLRRVIRAARKATDDVWVLGGDDSTHSIADEEGAAWRQEAGANVNESLRLVFEEVWSIGKSPLFLPGDLPFLQAKDISELIATTESNDFAGPQITLSPARSGGGTNAILIPQRLPFRLQLGPDSFSRHVEEVGRMGLEPHIHATDSLARDLDTWEDLREYESQQPGFLARLTREEH